MTSGISLACACHPKGLPRYILCLQGLPGQIGFLQDPGDLPGHPLRSGDLKCYDIAFQGDHGMDLEAEIGLFLGRAPSVICPVLTERTAVVGTSEFTDGKRKAVNHKITADRYWKGMDQFLPEQLRHLQKRPSGPVEPGTAEESGKEVAVFTFYKRIPGIFRIHSNQLAADAKIMISGWVIFAVSTFFLCETEAGTNCWYMSCINKQNKIFKSCYEGGIIILKLQYNVPPFIVVVMYNYRIAHFAEVFLNQLAQQVKL